MISELQPKSFLPDFLQFIPGSMFVFIFFRLIPPFANTKEDEKDRCESDPRDGGNFLGQDINAGEQEGQHRD